MRTRQQIVRTLVEDIVADVDEASGEVVLVVHWRGGQHTELRVHKPRTGEHRRRASEEAGAVIRSMAGKWSDEHIAASLNRLGLRTGHEQSWTAARVRSWRSTHDIHAYRPAEGTGEWLTMTQAATVLGVTNHVIRRLIRNGVLPAEQVVACAPYQIRAADLRRETVLMALRLRHTRPCRSHATQSNPLFPGLAVGGAQ
jgi:excisionase family DNA binding protein